MSNSIQTLKYNKGNASQVKIIVLQENMREQRNKAKCLLELEVARMDEWIK